jgi:hypothetical protein
MWLPEPAVDALAFNAERDELVLACAAVAAGGNRPATLLLDARGFLVGVDCDPDGTRQVLMLGPHEAVASQTPCAVMLQRGQLVIPGARRAVRGHEPNPYR